MTNIDKRIDEIMELDKKRTHSDNMNAFGCDWYFADAYPHQYEIVCWKEHHHTKPIPGNSNREANLRFIAKAPEMVSIIRELQAQVVEQQRLLEMCADHFARIHLRSPEQGIKDICDSALEQLITEES